MLLAGKIRLVGWISRVATYDQGLKLKQLFARNMRCAIPPVDWR
jgi:hypothetical protein